jgi:Domain of unknown function (DUF4375)
MTICSAFSGVSWTDGPAGDITRRGSGPSRRLRFSWFESRRGAGSAIALPYVMPMTGMGSEPLSRSELTALADPVDFVGTVIDWIWAKPWPSDDRSPAYQQYFLALPKEQRVIWSTWCVQGEVANGGFGQYFPNIQGDSFIEEARQGFVELGARDLAEMFDSVLTYFRQNRARIDVAGDSYEEYSKIMGYVAIEENLNNVTSRFLARMDDFYVLRRDYILRHLGVFCQAP